ncbi:MAG: efflux RND transporter periplasmic adaptor subunit [Deltaproteobacteria bacterium]|nr:efflux RND transporter periplasmic adaptor subunit [Deltaproteobacteria bacterium]
MSTLARSLATGVPGAGVRAGADPEVARTLGLGRSPRRRWLRLLLLLVALAALAALASLWLRARAAAARPRFVTAEVERGELRVTVNATGTVQALNTVEVGAEVSGRLTRVHVDYNATVEPGQLLAEIDREQLQAAADEAAARVAASQAAIRQAEATREETEAGLARAQAQVGLGLVSARDLEAARAAAARAEAQVASARADAVVARAALKSARWRLERTRIVSPIHGVVLSRLVEPGQTVTAGFQTPVLFKLAEDLRRMSLSVYVDEADVGRVREGLGASFTVDAYPGRTFSARLVSLRNEPKKDQNVVTYEAVLTVDNGELLLRPGMTASATILAQTLQGVLLVPNAALRFTPPAEPGAVRFGPRPPPVAASGPKIWVLEGGNPKAVAVKVGGTDGRSTQLLQADVAVGTKVVTDVEEQR